MLIVVTHNDPSGSVHADSVRFVQVLDDGVEQFSRQGVESDLVAMVTGHDEDTPGYGGVVGHTTRYKLFYIRGWNFPHHLALGGFDEKDTAEVRVHCDVGDLHVKVTFTLVFVNTGHRGHVFRPLDL